MIPVNFSRNAASDKTVIPDIVLILGSSERKRNDLADICEILYTVVRERKRLVLSTS